MSEYVFKEKKLYVDLFYDLGKCHKYETGGIYNTLAPEAEILAYMELMKTTPVYRIQIHGDGNVTTDCYELLDAFSPELEKYYETIDDLPKWVQDRLAVLMLLDYKKSNQEIPNVGRRITKDVFWVIRRDGEIDGDNA